MRAILFSVFRRTPWVDWRSSLISVRRWAQTRRALPPGPDRYAGWLQYKAGDGPGCAARRPGDSIGSPAGVTEFQPEEFEPGWTPAAVTHHGYKARPWWDTLHAARAERPTYTALRPRSTTAAFAQMLDIASTPGLPWDRMLLRRSVRLTGRVYLGACRLLRQYRRGWNALRGAQTYVIRRARRRSSPKKAAGIRPQPDLGPRPSGGLGPDRSTFDLLDLRRLAASVA